MTNEGQKPSLYLVENAEDVERRLFMDMAMAQLKALGYLGDAEKIRKSIQYSRFSMTRQVPNMIDRMDRITPKQARLLIKTAYTGTPFERKGDETTITDLSIIDRPDWEIRDNKRMYKEGFIQSQGRGFVSAENTQILVSDILERSGFVPQANESEEMGVDLIHGSTLVLGHPTNSQLRAEVSIPLLPITGDQPWAIRLRTIYARR